MHPEPDPELTRSIEDELRVLRKGGASVLKPQAAKFPLLREIATTVIPIMSSGSRYAAVRTLLERAISGFSENDREAARCIFLATGTLPVREEKAADVYGRRRETFRTGKDYGPRILTELAWAISNLKTTGRLSGSTSSQDQSDETAVVHRRFYENLYARLPYEQRKLVGLYGEPGTGKSVLAGLLVKRITREDDLAIFLNAKSEGQLLRMAADSLAHIPNDLRGLSIAADFARWLSGQIDGYDPPVAVVVDNVQQWESARLILPRNLPRELESSVIIVSNSKILSTKLGPSYLVEGMTNEEAARLTALHYPMDADESAAITEALGGHALAIEHACAILREQAGELSVSEMLDALRSDAKQVFDAAPYEDKLTGLYQILLDRIKDDPHLDLSWKLLQTYVFLTPQVVVDVAEAAFTPALRSSISPGLPRGVRDQALRQGIDGLKKFALLKVSNEEFCCKMLQMHQLTHSLILGLRLEADPDTLIWQRVRRAGMQVIQAANWNGGSPLPHYLVHWTEVIATNLQFGGCRSHGDVYPDHSDVFLLHSFLLRFDRQMGDLDVEGLEHYLEVYLQSDSKHGGADILAKEPLRLELIESGALRLKKYPRRIRNLDGPEAGRFRDLTARFRRDVSQGNLDYLVHEPTFGTVWYPVNTLIADDSHPTVAVVEERSQLEDNAVDVARWELLMAAIYYDQGEYSASEVNYLRVYEAAIRDDSLVGCELASRAALRALELHLRTGSTERLEMWLDRLTIVQTNDTWLESSRYNISWHLQIQKIYSDIRVAALLNPEGPPPSKDMELEARDLIQVYREMIRSLRRHALDVLIPHAEYQLGKVLTFLGELEQAKTRFANARRSSRNFFGAEFGELLAEVASIKVQYPGSDVKPTRGDGSIRRNVYHLQKIADLIAERGYSPYWEGDVSLTAWILAEQCSNGLGEAANEMRDRAEAALALVGRTDRLSRIIDTAPTCINPAWLLSD